MPRGGFHPRCAAWFESLTMRGLVENSILPIADCPMPQSSPGLAQSLSLIGSTFVSRVMPLRTAKMRP